MILDDVANRPEIIAAAKVVLAAMTPASPVQLASAIYRTFNHYDSFGRRTKEDKALLLEDWRMSLASYPVDMLEAMAKRWRENDSHGFMPTIGQFTDCLPAPMVDRFSALYKARRVAEQEWFG